jgi:hypothetical protein
MRAMTVNGFDLVRLGEIRGWLRSYAMLNTAFEQSDQWFDYTIEDLPWRGDLTESLQTHFDSLRRKEGDSWRLAVTEASPWRDHFSKVVERWFFVQPDLRKLFDGSRAGSYGLVYEQEPVSAFQVAVDDFLSGRDVRMWNVKIEGPGDFDVYAVMHENVVLQVSTTTLLHFDFQSND